MVLYKLGVGVLARKNRLTFTSNYYITFISNLLSFSCTTISHFIAIHSRRTKIFSEVCLFESSENTRSLDRLRVLHHHHLHPCPTTITTTDVQMSLYLPNEHCLFFVNMPWEKHTKNKKMYVLIY